LLKQEPWECLASFILSSTKQIVQIQQIVALLCERFGEPVPAPRGNSFAFPSVERIATLTEADLRCCKMGFRAPYLKGSAEMILRGEVNLDAIRAMEVASARAELMRLPGVGRKIADCVLLFAYGFQEAFPVDVWVLKAIRQLYFPRRRPNPKKILKFTETYFGPNAGYAQQYLFHYMRTRIGRAEKPHHEKN
jgi:N-glycosylase/DNA lyase